MPRRFRLWLPLWGLICLPLDAPAQASPAPPAHAHANPAALNVAWTSLAPQTLSTPATGPASGRILSVAVDPADSSGNTVYLGTMGGIWKSTNAASAASAVSFAPITDLVPALNGTRRNLVSVGAVSVQPGHTGVVLAGTGDPTSVSDSLYGTGLLRSADGGNSWSVIDGSKDPSTGLEQNSFYGEAFSGFTWGTSSPNFVVAAVTNTNGAYQVNAGYSSYSASGLYYSQDAGQTWLMATITDGQYQMIQGPGQVGTGVAALAVVWNPVRRSFYAAIRSHGFYQSPDGITWTRMATQPGTALTHTACPSTSGGGGSANCPIFQAALTVQPGTGDMFAMATSSTDTDNGLWQDVCAAVNGSCVTSAPIFAKAIGVSALETSSGTISGASHALWLQAVASGSDTLLLAGTQDLFRCSLAAGCSWRNATNVNGCAAAKVGSMQHAVAGVSGTSTFFFANDRGLWRTTDAMNQQQTACSADDASHFDNLNATLGPLAEITALAQDPTDASQLLAGLGAAGTAAGGSGAWQSVLNGPGAYVATGFGSNQGTSFATSGSGVSISSCAYGAQCGSGDFGSQPVIGNTQVSGDGSLLALPAVWALDPQNSGRMLVATCRIWRGSADGKSWGSSSALSGMLDGNPNPACNGNTQVRSFAATGTLAGRSDGAERIYAGLTGFPDGATTRPGHILTALVTPSSTATSTTWSDLTANPLTNAAAAVTSFNSASFSISSIAVDSSDTSGSTLYAGLSGYAGSGFAKTANSSPLWGSTDAGQHWTNLTNNLPNAPVNAVVVDPEDPAIVYVGTDVGVYVTTSVSQCGNSSQSCWAAYGTGLPAVRVTTLTVVDASGEKWLRAGTKGRGVWQTELASVAIQQSGATATLSPSTLSFSAQAVGTTSASQTLTIQNTGSIGLALGTITVTNSDFVANSQCPATLAAGASCTLQVVFAPTKSGQRSGTLSISANVSAGVLTAALSGSGSQGAVVVLTPLRMDFGSIRIGQTSSVQYMTISNTGTTTVGLSSVAISGPFTLSANTCGTSLAAATGCTVAIVFKPTVSGAASGTLVATDDASTQTAILSGTGETAPTDTLSTASLTFAAQALDTTSATQQVTITNNGDAALTLFTVQVTGDFSANNLCGSSLPAHSVCAIQVAFSPKALGAETGLLTIQDALGTQTVTLSGQGVAPAGGSGASVIASPVTVDFGIQGVNSISSAQTLTILNNGATTLSSIAVAASQSYSVAADSCSATLSPGVSCTVSLTFAPQTTGAVSGTVQVTAAELQSALQVPLTGTGADFQLSVQGKASSTVVSGSSATYQLLLTPVGASAGAVTFTCAGLPSGSTCTTNPTSVTMSGVGATATVDVTITTTAQTSHSRPLAPWGREAFSGIALACVVLWRRRGAPARLRGAGALAALAFLCAGLSGCGLSISGGTKSSSSSGSSQGVYTVTVSGVAPGLSHNVSLKLTVE